MQQNELERQAELLYKKLLEKHPNMKPWEKLQDGKMDCQFIVKAVVENLGESSLNGLSDEEIEFMVYGHTENTPEDIEEKIGNKAYMELKRRKQLSKGEEIGTVKAKASISVMKCGEGQPSVPEPTSKPKESNDKLSDDILMDTYDIIDRQKKRDKETNE